MKRLPIMITGVCLPLGKKRPKKYLSTQDARAEQKRTLSPQRSPTGNRRRQSEHVEVLPIQGVITTPGDRDEQIISHKEKWPGT
jgi:hypothetical protein